MRCHKHLSDRSSTVGVCATCVRHRLQLLIDGDPKPLPLPLPDSDCRRVETERSSNPPPSFVFPRSVSPYVARRKSDAVDFSDLVRHQRFFRTPQVEIAASKKKSKFQFFSNLFRSRSTKSRHCSSDLLSDPNALESSPSSSPHNSQKKHGPRLTSLDQASNYDSRRGRRFARTDRGMSPELATGEESDGHSPESWKQTPSRSARTSHARVKASPARSSLASGIGFCLSPLMRPSPSRNWAEAGYSGEVRPAAKLQLCSAASLRANRSRKLADFGRLNHNR